MTNSSCCLGFTWICVWGADLYAGVWPIKIPLYHLVFSVSFENCPSHVLSFTLAQFFPKCSLHYFLHFRKFQKSYYSIARCVFTILIFLLFVESSTFRAWYYWLALVQSLPFPPSLLKIQCGRCSTTSFMLTNDLCLYFFVL
jgi:hypothetical protein